MDVWFSYTQSPQCPLDHSYSGANWKVYEYCFMKQKRQIQMGISQLKNKVTSLKARGINTTHQYFQMSYMTLI